MQVPIGVSARHIHLSQEDMAVLFGHTPGIRVIGSVGELLLSEGVIIAARHIHMNPETASSLGVRERQTMSVRLGGARPLVLDKVHARISPLFQSELHIDTDDANAAGVETGDFAEIIEVHPFKVI
jgi:propanediol utilization protein